MLANTQGKKLNMFVSDYVVFDLETTGTNCNSDEVIEISAVKVIGGIPVDEFSMLVNPNMHIPYFATEVNGITDSMVKDAPAFDVALKAFNEFVEDLILVGHNINSFDMKFIWRDSVKYFGKILSNDFVDTLPIARVLLPGISHSLVNLSEYYGISSEGAHRALNDCRMNQLVYECLEEEMHNPKVEIKVCPKCGNFMKQRESKFGKFWGCMSYPECKQTINIRG